MRRGLGMAQDYTRVHEFYLQLPELQSPTLHFNHYDLSHAEPTYGLATTDGGGGGDSGGSGGGGGGGGGASATAQPTVLVAPQSSSLPPLPLPPSTHFPRKRKVPRCDHPERYEMSNATCSTRKRKPSIYATSSTYDDDCGADDSRSSSTMPDKKQNHSEIEKRRRDKMNTYITELSSMIPMCGVMARKLDKLTVLRMAVQHLRSVRGTLSACPLSARPKPAFLSERELNGLVLHAARDSFLLVVGCDRGRLLYVSASVKRMLHYDQSDLLGHSLFDILHPKDVAKVKEQLSSSDLSPRERLIDIKTMLPVKADVVSAASRLCPGARRSFFCRIKCKTVTDNTSPSSLVKEEAESTGKIRKKEKKYCVVQCTGYLKSSAPAEIPDGTCAAPEGGEDGEASLSCLVAVGRALPDLIPGPAPAPAPATRPLQYVSRHATDGKFLFVDQRVTLALGFLPQELLGTSLYEYVSGPELGGVARAHKQALLRREPLHTPSYSFRRKDCSLVRIQTHFKPFKNPWTKDVECLVANNTVVNEARAPQQHDSAQTSYNIYKQKADVEMQRLIDSQVESHKIGSAIAEEVLRSSSSEFSPDLPTDLLQDAVLNQQWQLTANLYEQASLADIICADMAGYTSQVQNNVPLSAAGGENSPPAVQPGDPMPVGSPQPVSPPLAHLGIDGNGEAAMAVIMTLLEADAGLGGPVNFSGLPWPLP